ncbi:MAG: TolC family protein [Candidatus Eremiobacteraeota bacterium]|nr:TolC family protein [Candidatus Eremiobacteraeota bacterium]
MIYFLALTLATASPVAATAAPTPIPTASPSVTASAAPSNDLGLPPVPNVEPGFRASDSGPIPTDIVGVDAPFVGLSLDDAIGMAVSRNTDLAVSQSNRRVSTFQIVSAQGAYDVRFQVQPQYTFSRQAALSSLEAGPGGGAIEQVTAGATAGFYGQTSTGGNFQATTTATRIDNNLSVNSYDPYYQTALAIQYSQPLARGLAIDANRRQIAISKINRDLSNDNALLQASNTVDNVLVAYYNLVAAWKNVAIQEDALRQARAQSASNGRLVRSGQAAPVDVVESNTQVNAFRDDVYSAIQNVASLQNTLKQLLLADPGDPIWRANLVPTSPITTVVPEPSVTDVVVAALKNRPEVGQLRENISEQDVNVAYARDQTKPQLDVSIGVTENGFAGAPTSPGANPFISVIGSEITSINQLIARTNAAGAPGSTPLIPVSAAALETALPAGTIGTIGQSYKTALQSMFPQYSISATLAFPLVDRTAKANYAAEVERRTSLATQEVGLIERVQTEARNAVQGYRSARSRLVAAGASRAAAEQVEASEERKFRAGASTTFLVLQRQVTLATARGSELQAQSDVQKALVELDRVTGNILANNHVDVSTLGTGSQGKTPNLVPAANTPLGPTP